MADKALTDLPDGGAATSGDTIYVVRDGNSRKAAFPSIPSGTVTSVGLSLPTGLEVSGSPVSTSGTFTVTWSSGYQGYTSSEASKLSSIEAGAQVNPTVASFGEFNSAAASRSLAATSVWASPVSLTDGSTISINLNNGYDFTVTLGGNRTLGAPSNIRHGKKGIIWVSASGATRTLTLNGAWVLEADAEEGPYEIATTERVGFCYACDGSTPRITGILRYS